MRQSSLRATQPSHGEAEMSEDEEEDGVTDRGVREPNGRGPATPKPPTMRRRTAVAGNTEPLGGKAREKKSRRRGIIACKHGCGYARARLGGQEERVRLFPLFFPPSQLHLRRP